MKWIDRGLNRVGNVSLHGTNGPLFHFRQKKCTCRVYKTHRHVCEKIY